MARLYKQWDSPRSTFGDLMVVGFLIMQGLDGVFTYVGVSIWGMSIEANPLLSSAMAVAGLTGGLAGAKLVAIGLGVLLHVRRMHNLVALLTAIYFAVAILPWTALFLTN
jgi:predicted CDP-diglyceride synthetase/phosphatidate cytidylyltransferase